MIISFTGHRPDFQLGKPDYIRGRHNEEIREALTDLIMELRPEECISGMALGIDQMAAEICVEYAIPFIAAVPFLGYEDKWPQASKDSYNKLLELAEKIHYVCEPGYAAWKNHDRNRWMVANSDLLIAIYDGTAGGTQACYNHAVNKKKRIIRINPTNMERTEINGV